MLIVQIEHEVADYDRWKAAFDHDPIAREASGVRTYRIYRPIEDPAYVAVDLAFDTRDAAERFEQSLLGMWRSSEAAMVLGGAPRSRIVDVVEERTY